jgi:hypothetical protein
MVVIRIQNIGSPLQQNPDLVTGDARLGAGMLVDVFQKPSESEWFFCFSFAKAADKRFVFVSK